jgi:succinate-semialdehyde dehydrogenase/glutarate-semialdehyde dehydrogenase
MTTDGVPRFELWIDGSRRAPRSGATEEATSPSSGDVVATVAVGGAADVDDAVVSAARAGAAWAARSGFARAQACEDVAAAVLARRDDLARLLTADQGKPLATEAYDEVDELAVYFTMAAGDARRLDGVLPPSVDAGRRILVQRVPLGVVAVVSPWNWPYTMAAELVAPALAAGNTVVWVPAPPTTACSALLCEIVGAVLPPGVLNFVSGPGPLVGDALVGHADVAAVGFVGSVATGHQVAIRAAGKAQILELGGNGPMVVLDDADVEAAATAALEAAFLCAGQSCTAGEVFLVHRDVRVPFVDAVVAATQKQVRLGDPFDPSTTMGPLNNERTASKVDEHVRGAARDGARVVVGGRRGPDAPPSRDFETTLIDGGAAEMLIAREETFGPVVPVVEIASFDEAVALTNASAYGLTAAVFTRDLARGLLFAESVRTGWVNVNASTNLWESHLPFGGRAGSLSGTGRVGGSYPLERFTEARTVTFPLSR